MGGNRPFREKKVSENKVLTDIFKETKMEKQGLDAS